MASVLPVTLLSSSVVRHIGKQRYLVEQEKFEAWDRFDTVLIPHIIDYIQQHPDSVTYPYGDDRARIVGLGAYLRKQVLTVTFVDDDIMDPWGDPVWVVLDHDGDMQLRFDDLFYGVWAPRGNKVVVQCNAWI